MRPADLALPALGVALLAVCVLVGALVSRPLGVPIPPFAMRPDASVGPGAVAAVAALAAAVLGLGRLSWPRAAAPRGRWRLAWVAALIGRSRLSPPRAAAARLDLSRPPAVAALLAVAALAVRLAVNAARSDGTGGWTRTFDLHSREGPLEYVAGRDALAYGRHFFLDRFAELTSSLPVHVAGHPPGLVLGADLVGAHSAASLAAWCIGAGALIAPLTYALARELLAGDEPRARAAGALAALAPGAVLIGATSADALYATVGTAAATLLVARGRARRAAGAALLAVGSFANWALLAVGAFAVLRTLLAGRAPRRCAAASGIGPAAGGGDGAASAAALAASGGGAAIRRPAQTALPLPGGGGAASRRATQAAPTPPSAASPAALRERLRPAAALALLCTAAFAGFHGALALAWGWDPIGTVAATEDVYRHGISQLRPWWYWVGGSPSAWAAFGAGPIALVWLGAAGRREPTAVALLAVVAIAAVLGLSKAETERIWLFLVPYACVAAAAVLPRRWLTPLLALCALQALAVQLLFDTVW